jgi:threonine/homoserine/homoserine lactone efflux protein
VPALALGVGSLLHAGAAALGLSVVLAYSPSVYAAMKYLGATYLAFLGIRMLLARDGRGIAAAGAMTRMDAGPPAQRVRCLSGLADRGIVGAGLEVTHEAGEIFVVVH